MLENAHVDIYGDYIYKPLFNCVFIIQPSKHILIQSSNRNIRKSCEICSELTIKTPERRQ